MSRYRRTLSLVMNNRKYLSILSIVGIGYWIYFMFIGGILIIARESSQIKLIFYFDPTLIIFGIILSLLIGLTISLSIYTIKRVPKCSSGTSTGLIGTIISMFGCCGGLTLVFINTGWISIAVFIRDYIYILMLSAIILLTTSFFILIKKIDDVCYTNNHKTEGKIIPSDND